MENIIFNNYIQMVNFFKNCEKELGYGTEGYCYKQGNMSYKLYNHLSCLLNNTSIRMSELLKFKNIIIENIYFIRCLIFLKEDLIGVGSDFAPGVSCNNVFLHRKNLDRIVNALGILKKNIYELSSYGIYIDDGDLENILYNDKVFSLIDTADYYCLGDKKDDRRDIDNVDTIYKKNMSEIMKQLFRGITNANTLYDNFILAYLNDINSEYKDYLIDTDLMLNPDETIIGIRNIIQENIGREIICFSSCRRDLLKIIKK